MSAGSPDTSLCKPCIDLGAEACQCVGCKSDSHGGDGPCRNTRDHHIEGAGGFCGKCFRKWECAKCGAPAKAFKHAESRVRDSNLHLCASCCDAGEDVQCQPCFGSGVDLLPFVPASSSTAEDMPLDPPRCVCHGCAGGGHAQSPADEGACTSASKTGIKFGAYCRRCYRNYLCTRCGTSGR